jgi:type IV pilus assembly protein PilA
MTLKRAQQLMTRTRIKTLIPTFSRNTGRRRSAFTLIEILVVVVILGVLASIAVPLFSNATHDTRESMLKDELRYLRSQILVFKVQHRDTPPGYPLGDSTATPTEADFVTQMTGFSSDLCGTSATPSSTYKYGPYLSAMPKNPLNDSPTILMMDNGQPLRAPASDGYGWIYRPETQEIIANLPGADATGRTYASY